MTGFWSIVLRVGLLSFLLVTLNWRAGLAADPAIPRNEPGSVTEKTDTPKEDDRLPIQKEGWQFFLAPYLWVPGVHLDLSHQGKFSGTTVADVPWYELVPLLFSKVIGGMGRVEIWNGRWGVFSDTNFMYIGDSISGGGAKTLELNSKQLPATIPVNLQLSGDLKIWTRLFWQDVGVRYLVGTVPLQGRQTASGSVFRALGRSPLHLSQSGHQPGPQCHPHRPFRSGPNQPGRVFFQ